MPRPGQILTALAIFAIYAIACTVDAQAEPYAPGPAMAHWQAIGADRFPPPCEVELETGPVVAGDFAAYADPPTCTITLAPAFWVQRRIHRCALIVHEYGHLAGLGHVDDYENIMDPRAPIFGEPRCKGRDR